MLFSINTKLHCRAMNAFEKETHTVTPNRCSRLHLSKLGSFQILNVSVNTPVPLISASWHCHLSPGIKSVCYPKTTTSHLLAQRAPTTQHFTVACFLTSCPGGHICTPLPTWATLFCQTEASWDCIQLPFYCSLCSTFMQPLTQGNKAISDANARHWSILWGQRFTEARNKRDPRASKSTFMQEEDVGLWLGVHWEHSWTTAAPQPCAFL